MRKIDQLPLDTWATIATESVVSVDLMSIGFMPGEKMCLRQTPIYGRKTYTIQIENSLFFIAEKELLGLLLTLEADRA